MSYPAIEAKGVRFSYGKNEILHGVDFAAQKGQLVAVLGPNGAGKSTLFRCLLGLYHSYQGSIAIEGREVKNMQPREIAAKVAKTMVTGAVSLSYEEMEIVLDYIHLNIEDSKRRNEAREKENRDVSEDK